MVKNGAVEKYPYTLTDLRFDNPGVSFPRDISDDDAKAFGAYRVSLRPEPVVSFDQVAELAHPVFSRQENCWVQVWSVRNKSADEIAQETQAIEQSVRFERDELLAKSDWTQVADAPVDAAAWATYRQALRDITAQPGFPFSVNWPAPPA